MRTHETTKIIAIAVALCSLAIPASAGAQSGGLPTPDTFLAQRGAEDGGGPRSDYPEAGYASPDTYLAQRSLGGHPTGRPAASLPTPDTFLAQRGIDVSPGGPQLAVEPTTVSDDGFDWGDALIGALIAAAMTLAAGAARSVGRHRRTPVDSRV